MLHDLAQQLSEMRLPDGRRGMHLLSDLKFSNVEGFGSDEANPWISFDVAGAKFTGKVKVEYVWGADTYTLHFEPTPVDDAVEMARRQPEFIEDVHFDQLLEFIEDRCDSSLARRATVQVLRKAKRAAPVA